MYTEYVLRFLCGCVTAHTCRKLVPAGHLHVIYGLDHWLAGVVLLIARPLSFQLYKTPRGSRRPQIALVW
jgi:hypothetical protein